MTSHDITTGAARCTITIDEDLCTGNGLCLVYGPETFDMTDELKSTVMDPPFDDLPVIRAAVASCPNRAITLTEH